MINLAAMLIGNAIQLNGGGGSITVDDALSGTSTNPVQNKVVKGKFDTVDAATSWISSAAVAANNGKILAIQNGAVTAVEITSLIENGEEVGF